MAPLPKKKPSHESTHAQFKRALFGGGKRLSLGTVEHECSGDCTDPIYQWVGNSPADDPALGHHIPFHQVHRWVRCRKCENCKKAHARHWATRATKELRVWPRTWFMTLTYRPGEHTSRLFQSDGLADYRKLCIRDVTLMFKRMRKFAPLRYVAVIEPHKTGFIHHHVLLHEVVEGSFTSRDLSGNQKEGVAPRWWPHGHVHCRLVPDGDAHKRAWYVCKYIAKDHETRVRASQKYGL